MNAPRKKILFVCTINRMRSATAHHLYAHDPRFEVTSAGTDAAAATVVTQTLMDWADSVVVMEKYHRNILRKKYPEVYKSKKIVCLYIPDEYDFMQPALIDLLQARFERVYEQGLV